MAANYNERISGETPFKPEYDEFVNEYPGRGSLKVQTSVAQEAFPIRDVFVDVSLLYKGRQGPPLKLAFYAVYPVHLAILGALTVYFAFV